MKCQATTRKKAWNNPLAPRAKCSKDAMKDGFCKQHHPDAVKARNEALLAKWNAKRKAAGEQARRESVDAQMAEELRRNGIDSVAALRELLAARAAGEGER